MSIKTIHNGFLGVLIRTSAPLLSLPSLKILNINEGEMLNLWMFTMLVCPPR